MERKKRKTYYKPEFNQIVLDKEIRLIMATEDNPPGPPFATSVQKDSDISSASSTESTEDPLKKNNFEDNPFDR